MPRAGDSLGMGGAEARATDGRMPGRRGQKTRQKLLDCTRTMLERGGYRDLKIVDIAREAGTSPATFYQYFPDVEGALVVLAGQMAEDGRNRLPASVTTRPWEPTEAYRSTLLLVDDFFAFWEDHRPLMRVIDLAAAEGNPEIRGMRMGMMNEFARALSTVVHRSMSDGDLPEDTDALAVASVVVTLLVNVAIQRYQFEFHNISSTSVDEAVRRMVFTALTGRLVAEGNVAEGNVAEG